MSITRFETINFNDNNINETSRYYNMAGTYTKTVHSARQKTADTERDIDKKKNTIAGRGSSPKNHNRRLTIISALIKITIHIKTRFTE